MPLSLSLTHHHDNRSKVLPAEVPEEPRSRSNHLFNVSRKLVDPVKPRDGDRLEEADPEKGHARGGVKVHDLKQVDAALSDETLIKRVCHI
jgi:hypothetical protein